MPEYDGEVIIHAELDKGDFESNIDRLSRLLQEKKAQIELLKAQYASFAKGESKSQEQLNTENKINQLLEKRNDIVAKLWGSKNVTAAEMVKLNTELNNTNNTLEALKKKLNTIEISPASTNSVRNLYREITKAEKEANKLSNTISQKLEKSAIEQAKSERFAQTLKSKYDLKAIDLQARLDREKFKSAERADLEQMKSAERTKARIMLIEARAASEQIKIAERKLALDKSIQAKAEIEQAKSEERKLALDKKIQAKAEIEHIKSEERKLALAQKLQAKAESEQIKIAENRLALDKRLQAKAEIEQAKMAERAQVRAQMAQERLAKEQARLKALAAKNTKTFGEKFKGVFSSLTSPINSVISGISTLGKRILRLGSYVLIFNVIRSGFRKFRDYITAALSTNSVFMNSLNKLKSNLMVAFYPIYQYILPALNTLMSVLIKASSYLANFFSMITGTTIKQSVSGAKAIYDSQQAMKSTGAATDSATKSIKDQKAAFDKLGKSINGSKKELAAFDKLIVLGQDKEKEPKIKTPKDDGFVFTPDTKIPEPDIKWMDDFINSLKSKLKPTIESFQILGDTIREKIGKFAKTALEDFNREYLVPISDYLLQQAIPKFNQITTDMINGTDWDNLNNSLNNFWKSLEPFNETIGNGLLTFYENVIKPFTEWAIGNFIPAALDALTGALKFLNPVAEQAGDYLGKLYNTFLKPAAEWTGELIVNGLKGIGDSLSTIGDWIDKNSWFVEIVGSLITGITTALIGYNAVMFVTSGALAAAATSAWAFTTALLANPITWIVGLVGLLIAALIELAIHWDDVKQAGVNFFDAIKKSIQGIMRWFKWLGDEIGKFFGMFKFLGNGVNFSPRDQFDFSKYKPFTSQIPKRMPGLAQGAVLKGGDPMLAYLNDQPRGQTNIETPLDTMVQAFNEALSRNNNSAGNVVIQADGDVAGIVDMLRFRIKQRDELIGTNYIQDGIFT